jgi:Protein of unknown function (DUF3667)
MSQHHHHAMPAACENCATVLSGDYCHVCGQRTHSPLRHFGHAVEEVLESFWHLDGRIFRTLRDLCVPGRVAAGYLAGHRVRYVAPLRLFIILSLLTFFVGKLTLHFDPDSAVEIDPGPAENSVAIGGTRIDDGGIGRAKTVDEVLRLRAKARKALADGRKDEQAGWLLSAVSDFAATQIEDSARTRMRELGATPQHMRMLDMPADTAMTPPPVSAPPAAEVKQRGLLQRWFERRLTRLRDNAEIVQKTPDEFVKLVLSAVPGALFILVPLFALCLKLLYIRSRRGYLEHLVVALYSHAFMLAALLLTFLLIGLQAIPGLPAWGVGFSALLATLTLCLLVPLYLLWMQKRVYAQGWVKTLTKYATLGLIYSFLLGLAILYAVLAGLSS